MSQEVFFTFPSRFQKCIFDFADLYILNNTRKSFPDILQLNIVEECSMNECINK